MAGDTYSTSQTAEDYTIEWSLPAEFHKKNLKIKFTVTKLSVIYGADTWFDDTLLGRSIAQLAQCLWYHKKLDEEQQLF